MILNELIFVCSFKKDKHFSQNQSTLPLRGARGVYTLVAFSEKHPYELRSQASPQNMFCVSLVLKGTILIQAIFSIFNTNPQLFHLTPYGVTLKSWGLKNNDDDSWLVEYGNNSNL